MKIVLCYRHYGVHKPIKEINISGNFSDYCVLRNTILYDDFLIDENKLLTNLPKDFLPVKPELCLLTIGDDCGSTGQIGLNKFLNWSKYFDCYILELEKESM